jgi:hypothetical protein
MRLLHFTAALLTTSMALAEPPPAGAPLLDGFPSRLPALAELFQAGESLAVDALFIRPSDQPGTAPP